MRVYATVRVGGALCIVCCAYIADGDCQVGYKEMVMTTLRLPGRSPTQGCRLAAMPILR